MEPRSGRTPTIARVRLARSTPRLLAVPFAAVVVSASACAAGILAGGPIGIGAAIVAALVGLTAVVAAVVLFSVRLYVEESALRLRWVGGERRYALTRGAVTRVTVRGRDASALRYTTGMLGFGFGRARLRGEEEIQLIRLAPTATVILIPTEVGRLAISAASESELLDALVEAAQTRRRLDEIARMTPPGGVEDERVEVPEAHLEEPEPAALPEPMPPEPVELTGIERALLEERLAAERAAVQREPETAPLDTPAVARAAPERGRQLAPAPATAARAPAPSRLRVTRPSWLRTRGDPGLGASVVLVLLPVAAAGAAWGAATALDVLPALASDDYRLTTLAIVLAGPGTSVAATIARIWWPRLVGVVVTCGLATLVIAARAILSLSAG